MRRLAAIFLIIGLCGASELSIKLERALKSKDREAFFSLFLSPGEEERELFSFLKDRKVEEAVVREDRKGDYIYLTMGVLCRGDVLLQQWKVKLKEGKIAWKKMVANFANLMWFEPQDMHAYRIKNFTAKVKDIVFVFKKGTLYLYPTFAFVVGKGNYTFSPSNRIERLHLRHVFGKERLKGKIKALLLRYGPSSVNVKVSFEVLYRKAHEKGHLKLFSKLSKYGGSFYSRFFGRNLFVNPPEAGATCVFVDSSLGNLSYYYSPRERDGIILQNLSNSRIISLYSEAGLFFEGKKPDVEMVDLKVKLFSDGRVRVKALLSLDAGGSRTIGLKLMKGLKVVEAREEGKRIIFLRPSANQLNLYPEGTGKTRIEITYWGRAKQILSYSNMLGFPTQAEVLGGSWIPSIPGDFFKVRAEVSLPEGQICLASAKLVGRVDSRFVFHSQVPVGSFYLIRGNFKKLLERGGKPILTVYSHHASRKKAAQYVDFLQEALRFLSQRLGQLPYPQLYVVFNPSNHYIAQSFPYLLDVRIFRSFPLTYRRYVPDFVVQGEQQVLVHELVHQWFGGAVKPDSYREVWINEGIAQMLSLEIFKNPQPYYSRMRKAVIREKFLPPLVLGGRIGHYRDDLYSYFLHNYMRSGLIFKTLQEFVGEETFYRALRAFIEKKKFSTYRWGELAEHFSLYLGFDGREFFIPWIMTSRRPEVEIRKFRKGDGLQLQVIQKRVVSYRGREYPFVFPLKVMYEKDGKWLSRTFKVRSSTEFFSVPSSKIKVIDYFLPLKLKFK